ncbi:MAG: hypothetical protein A2020_09075 [Lentisphaerae bacterium GWF2_45_14]|nr:MAG: hypothetical protein A2020_09075 [Lentisphaerae bacterium GWF2_45_14]
MNDYKINADWIAPKSSAEKKNFYFRAVKKFEIGKLSSKVNLHIAAESFYILYINGIEIGKGPARGTHSQNFYDTYDAAPYLKQGENIIAVLCLCMNIETFTTAPGGPGLILEIENILKTDESWELSSIENEWKQDVRTYTMQTGFCEWRDMRKEPLNWLLRKDNNVWEKASVLSPESEVVKKKLLPRNIPFLKETEYTLCDIPAKALVPELKDLDDIDIAKIMTEEKHLDFPKGIADRLNGLTVTGEKHVRINPPHGNQGAALVFNFKREIIGRFELDISAPAGTVIDITHEEELWNKRLRADHTHTSKSYNLADRYILRDGRQKIGNSLMERGFRLVQIVIRNFPSPVTIHNVRALDRRYPFSAKASFNCSETLLNKIWDVCSETLSACTTDIFTDCPWRERSFWVNDLIVENRTALQAFGDPRIHKRAFQMAFSDAFENGLVPGVCPCPRDQEILILLPTNLYITLMLKDYYLYTGDSSLLKEFLPRLMKILELFKSWQDTDGIINPPEKYWNFFDWSYEMNGFSFTGKRTSMLNYFYIIALKTVIELADEIKFDIGKDKYLEEIRNVSENTEKIFFMNEEKRFANSPDDRRSSQLPHALAILSGEYSDCIEKYIKEALTDEQLLTPELYFQFFIFQAMKKTGQESEILKRIRKYWGNMIKTGTPTLWEAGIHKSGKEAFGGSASLCHGFAAAPIDFFQTIILGITPSRQGFKEFIFNPFPFDIKSAEGSIPTPSGKIEVKWEKSAYGLSVFLKVPNDCKALTYKNGTWGPGCHEFEIKQENEI